MAEGRVRWAFWPPDADFSAVEGESSDGIWIPHATDVDDDTEFESEDDESDPHAGSQDVSRSEETSESEEDEVRVQTAGIGRFGTLVLDDETSEDDLDLRV